MGPVLFAKLSIFVTGMLCKHSYQKETKIVLSNANLCYVIRLTPDTCGHTIAQCI